MGSSVFRCFACPSPRDFSCSLPGNGKPLELTRPFLSCLSFQQEQVQSNADLDIPTQQELLAQFRCDEIATVAVDAFLANLKGVKRPVETGQVLEGLGGMLAEWKALALSKFYSALYLVRSGRV